MFTTTATTLVLALTALVTLYWYFFRPHNEARLKAEFAQRKVHYHKQPNAFFQVLRRERNDLHKQTEGGDSLRGEVSRLHHHLRF